MSRNSFNTLRSLNLRKKFALVAVGVVVASLAILSLSSVSPSLAASDSLVSCGNGVPALKCNPSLDSTYGAALPTTNPPPISSAPTGPAGAVCSSIFFSSDTWSQLTSQFGIIDCFSLPGSDQWVVVGDGMSTTSSQEPPPPSSGGAIVAVESCSASDTSCLSASTQHDFGQFTVYYPPNPSVGEMNIATTAGPNLVNLIDGVCGSFTFDSTNGEWFATSPSALAALTTPGALIVPVESPAPTTGASALLSPAPANISGSCFVG